MAWESLAITASAMMTAMLAIGAVLLRILKHMISGIVDKSVTDMIHRQSDFEDRMSRRLDYQDSAIWSILRGMR